ncbi:MAG: FAD-dependent oxidoreductase [Chthoniobacteraceae bacterium]|jgi:NADH dehydrogenase
MGSENRLQFDVLIAGGGFAGVYCAQAIARKLGISARERVAIVADHNYMVFQPMLAEVAGSSISPHHVVNPIRGICRNVNVMRGSIAEIDLAGRSVRLDAGMFSPSITVCFDHLVIALGGVVDLSRVPGMPEHAFLMKSVGDAQELRGALIDRLEEANLQTDQAAIKRLLTFVIVGGGYSGVETAGQLLDLIQDINRFYPRIARPNYRVILVHSGSHLLPEISEDLGRYCEQNMTRRGVEFILNARVTSMTASKVTLNDGRVLETHTVVSTVGNAPHPLIVDLCKRDGIPTEKSRIITDASLRVQDFQNLWAAGDCAAVPMAGGKGAKKQQQPMGDASPFVAQKYCPPTAQFAYRQGICLGKNLANILQGSKEPLRTFTFTGLGELASIGHQSAVADIMGLRFSGLLAWFMWRTIYLMKLPGLDRKVRVVIDWTLDLFFPRDITLLRSRPTEVLQEVHLEKGDVVFHSGEPALSFYVVKKGRIDLNDGDGTIMSIGPGEHFGERALLHDRKWRFNAVAAEPTILVSLEAKVFQAISSASSSIREFFEHSSQQYLSRQQIDSIKKTVPDALLKMKVSEVMAKNPVFFRTTETIGNALATMVEHPFNSFPLLDANDKLLGIVTQPQVYDALKDGDITNQSTMDKLTPLSIPTIHADTLVTDALETLMRSGRNKLLVVDPAGKLQGVLTPIDLLGHGAKL